MDGGGGGDDGETPPAEAFKNVPQRARSDSGDSRGGGPGAARTPAPTRGEDGPPAVAPSAGREEEHPEDAKNGGGDDYWQWLLCQEILEDANGWMRGLDEWPEDANNHGGGGAPPAPSQTDEASASSGRERPAGWDEKARIRKGKMKAANNDDDDASAAAAAPGPAGGDKLMGDAIRSHGGAAAVAFSKKKPGRPSKSNKRKDPGQEALAPPFWYGLGSYGQSTSMAGSNLDYSFVKIAVVSTRLRAALAGLGLGLGLGADAPVNGDADAATEEPPPSPPESDDEGGAGGNTDAAAMENVAGDAGDKGQDDAGVNGDAAAAASSSEACGAASKAGAPGEADGTKTEEKEASAPTSGAAARSSSSDAGGVWRWTSWRRRHHQRQTPVSPGRRRSWTPVSCFRGLD